MNYLNLSKEDTAAVVAELNQVLAEYHLYYQKLRNFHWNVKGKSFFSLHEKFETMYEDARLKIDEIAERILTLRETPTSNMSEYLKVAKIQEASSSLTDVEMVKGLINDQSILIEALSKLVAVADEKGDEGTLDIASPYIREIETDAWMLSAFVAE